MSRSSEFLDSALSAHENPDIRPAPVAARNGIPLGPLTRSEVYDRLMEKRFSEAD